MPPQGNGNGNDERKITYFATTHTRGRREMFGIRAVDRGKHIYVIGKTGMGKSTMLENMAIQDIQNGEGIAYIDPHGSTAEKLLDFVPAERIKDVLYFAPFDTDYPVGFNVMEDVGYDKRHLVVSGLMGAFKRIWVDAWSARMEYILQNVLLALLEYPGSTLLDVNRMLTNKKFRAAVVERVTDPLVKSFWVDEFAGYTDRYTQEATPAIQNKVGQFVANPLIRNIVGQPRSSFDLRKMMDERKIFIVNLSKGRMGETNASLLGSMLTVKIYLAAMSRADESAARIARLPRCYFYVDEFQSMMNEAFADILSESRKYKLALTLANQYIEQMEENVRNAVFGNVGTLITFRVGPFDAEVLKTVFEPTFMAEVSINLGIGQIYLTLMIDGVGSAPFSAETIPPIEAPNISYREDVIQSSRSLFGRKRSDVENAIVSRQNEFPSDPPKPKNPRDSSGPRPYPPQGQNRALDRDRGDRPPQDRPDRGDRNERPAMERPRRDERPSRAEDRPRAPFIPNDAPARPQEIVQRSALKDAIAAAQISQPSKTPLGSPVTLSPLEMLRQKRAQKESHEAARLADPQASTPTKPPPARVDQPKQDIKDALRAAAHMEDGDRPEEKSRPADAPPGPPLSPDEKDLRAGEVPNELLARVLNGK